MKNCEEAGRGFSGVRFYLAGFDTHLHNQFKTNLVSVGAVHVGHYSPDVTHVIVYNLLLDDTVCVTARRDGKILVNSLWVEHSLDVGVPYPVDSIIYRPPKDRNGIPGAQDLIICVTGYPRHQRDDIMAMVEIMGAEFSKPLMSHKVTHLICYEFKGKKYEMAMKSNVIKLINHLWLEDCIKEWKILPEENYTSISSLELEMGGEVKDTDDETEEIPANVTVRGSISGIPISQIETGKVHDQYVIASNRSAPSVQVLSNSVSTDERKSPLKPDKVTPSRNSVKTEKQSPVCPNKVKQDGRFLPSNQIVSNLPSISGNAKSIISCSAEKLSSFSDQRKTPVKSSLPLCIGEDLGNFSGPSSKRPADSHADYSSPCSSRKTPRKSGSALHTEKKSGRSDRRPEEDLRSDDVQTCNGEMEKITADTTCIGVPSSGRSSDVDAAKYTPPSLRRSPRKSGVSLESSGRLGIAEGRPQENLSEKASDVVPCNSSRELDKQRCSAYVEVSGAETALNREGSCGLQKTSSKSDLLHTTTKSQKLTASASKRIDAADPATPVSAIGKSKNASPSLGSHAGGETARTTADKSSPDVSSVKSKVKKTATSNFLVLDKLQGSGSDKMSAETGLSSGHNAECTKPDVGSTNFQPQNLKGMLSVSPEAKDSNAAKSGSPELNTDEKVGNSDSMPPRKKMVARRTLGSRPKASKKSSDVQKGPLNGDLSGGDAVLHPVGQLVGEKLANSSVVDKTSVLSTDVGSKPLQKSAMDMEVSDTELFHDETEPPPVLDVQHDKSTTEASHLTERRATETSKVGPPAVKCSGTVLTKKMGISGRAKKKSLVNGVIEDGDGAVGEEGREKKERMKEDTAAGKKRCGAQLTKRPVAAKKGHGLVVPKDQGTSDGVQHSVSLKKRRGTLLLNKSAFDKDEGQNDGEDHPETLPGKSNFAEELMEVENENGAVTGDVQCPTKGVKRTGKKRRGTLLLEKSEDPVSPGKENLSVYGEIEKSASASIVAQCPIGKEKEDDPEVGNDQVATKGKKLAGKKRRRTLVLNKSERSSVQLGKENELVLGDDENRDKGVSVKSNQTARKLDVDCSDPLNAKCDLTAVKNEPAWFIVSGHRLQRKEFHQLIKRLKGKHCRDSHHWSYQATHFVVPDPIRRTEKFFAAAASGRWILKTDYLTASSQAGKFLPEEPYEWHKNELTQDGAINLEAPRKWRLLREKTGHGAFYGMRIIIYGECIAPPLDTLKRVVKAGDGTILATSPPYTRFLNSEVDFAIVSPGMPRVDIWVQEFLRHEIPCVLADYLVEYVCRPGYPLDRHVQYNTHEWAAKSFSRLMSLSNEVVTDAAVPEDEVSDDLACEVCGSSDRAEVMLVCGDERGSTGCGVGTHIDCCDPPLEDIPEEDWFCPKCSESKNKLPASTKKKTSSKRR